MPQPVPEGSRGRIPSVGPSVLPERPKLAPLVAEVIATFVHVEVCQLDLFVKMMGGPFELASAVYMSLETSGPKSAAISAVANAKLPPDERAVFSALLKRASSLQKMRDRVAHWIWGVSDDFPDALVLHDPIGIVDPRRIDRQYLYREKDFTDIIEGNIRLSRLLIRFYYAIGREPNERALLMQSLSAEAEIAALLRPLTA